MKRKLRTIKVETDIYLYSTHVTCVADTEESIFTMRIFKDKYSKHALFVHFRALDDYYVGNLFHHGVLVYNAIRNQEDVVNLNRPLFVRLALDYGLNQGWQPTIATLEVEGLVFLKSLGYDVSTVMR